MMKDLDGEMSKLPGYVKPIVGKNFEASNQFITNTMTLVFANMKDENGTPFADNQDEVNRLIC